MTRNQSGGWRQRFQGDDGGAIQPVDRKVRNPTKRGGCQTASDATAARLQSIGLWRPTIPPALSGRFRWRRTGSCEQKDHPIANPAPSMGTP